MACIMRHERQVSPGNGKDHFPGYLQATEKSSSSGNENPGFSYPPQHGQSDTVCKNTSIADLNL